MYTTPHTSLQSDAHHLRRPEPSPFRAAGPRVWNYLPTDIGQSDQGRIQRGCDGRGRRPLLASDFFSVSRLFPDKRPISLLFAFTINDDGADTLSSPPTTIFKNSGFATAVKLATQPFQTVAEGVFIYLGNGTKPQSEPELTGSGTMTSDGSKNGVKFLWIRRTPI